MEESQKVGDPFLQQVIILAGVLPSQKERGQRNKNQGPTVTTVETFPGRAAGF